MKRIVAIFFVLGAVAMASVLNIYSERHYDADQMLYELFEEETGVKINVVQARAEELIQRMTMEGRDTPADLFITVGAGNLFDAKNRGLLQSINSKALNRNVPELFRDKEGYWYGLTYRARVFIYNPELTNPSELSTYEALADPKYRGKILTRTSTNTYNQHLIAAMIANNGYSDTVRWARGLVRNFARSPRGNDRDQSKAIIAGEGEIAIMNTYYMGNMSRSSDPIEQEVFKRLRIFFPNQDDRGTHINLSGAGVVRHSKNKENAIKFLEFLTRTDVQEKFAQANSEYPVNEDAEPSDVIKSWGTFKIDPLSFKEVAENLRRAQFLADEAGWR